MLAIYTGPAGIALLGSFSNFISIALTFANGAINNGVVKYTAEHNDDEQKLKDLFSTAFKISFACSIVLGIILFAFASIFSKIVFIDYTYTIFIRVLGLAIVFYSLNSLFISILNGKGQINLYTIINSIGSVVSLLFTLLLVYEYRITGALYALVLSQSIVFFITFIMIIKSPWFSWDYFKKPFNILVAKKLSNYSLMAIVTALTIPVAQILIRNMLISKLGVNSAGYWQGVTKVSDGYLMIVTTSLSTYYLPKLSSLKKESLLRKEIFYAFKIVMPLVLISCLVIYLSRFIIIKALYTSDFIAMEKLFVWQLIGDFFKIAAWILAYLMLAKAMTKSFIITEIIFSIGYVVLSFGFVNLYSLEGVTMAFALNYLILFLTMSFIFRKLLFNLKNE